MKIEIENVTKESEKEYGKYDKWEIDTCVDTLIKAEEIKADPEKMVYVKPLLEKKMAGITKTIKSIKDIRAKAASMESEE